MKERLRKIIFVVDTLSLKYPKRTELCEKLEINNE
jgi:hypothetical protein